MDCILNKPIKFGIIRKQATNRGFVPSIIGKRQKYHGATPSPSSATGDLKIMVLKLIYAIKSIPEGS